MLDVTMSWVANCLSIAEPTIPRCQATYILLLVIIHISNVTTAAEHRAALRMKRRVMVWVMSLHPNFSMVVTALIGDLPTACS
jgi:hypothetical protein